MKTPALLLLVSLFVLSLDASAEDVGKATMPPFPLTATEEANARALAQKILTDKFLPAAARSPESYYVQGVDLSGAHLGDPFLDVTLRGRSIDDYRESAEDDPRLFPSVLYYCFPVFVAGRQDAILSIVVIRNQDEDRQPFSSYMEEGPVREQPYPPEEFIFFGYGGQEGRTADAVQLRARYGHRVSFVHFLDQGLPLYIMVDDSTGVLCGAKGDTLVSIHEGASNIKGMLR